MSVLWNHQGRKPKLVIANLAVPEVLIIDSFQ